MSAHIHTQIELPCSSAGNAPTAAEATITSLEQTIQVHVAELDQRRAEVTTLTRENSKLRSELNDALDQLGPAQQAAAGARRGGDGSNGAATALLRDENDILAEQVEQYNAALMQARDELSMAAKENVELTGKYQSCARDLHRLENELAATGIRRSASTSSAAANTNDNNGGGRASAGEEAAAAAATTLDSREAKAALEEAQARTKLAEQIQSELKSSCDALQQELQETQAAFVELQDQMGQGLADASTLNDAVAETQQNAEDATERELQAYKHVQECVEMLEAARLERDQAQSAKARTTALVDELEAKLVEFSAQAKRDLASALQSAKDSSEHRISQQMKELDELQRQNSELAMAVERMAKAKSAAEKECEKLARGVTEDEGMRAMMDQLQSQLTTAHRVSEQHRMRAEIMDTKLELANKELVQAADGRRHEVAETERRLQARANTVAASLQQITKHECSDEQLKAQRLGVEVQNLNEVLADTRGQLAEAARSKDVETSLLHRQLTLKDKDCQAKLDSNTDLCERTLEDFRRLMSDQQRKAGHTAEELLASVRRLEKEVASVRQQADFRQERLDAICIETAQLKKDQHNTARRLADSTTQLELAAKLASDEQARADAADLQVLELLARQEALMRELSLAREARDACDLEAKKSKRAAERAKQRVKETEQSLAETSAVLANRALSRAA
eukprot:gene18825-33691_t